MMALQRQIEKIYAKRKRLAITEDRIKSLRSAQPSNSWNTLSSNTSLEMQKAKKVLIDDYAQNISKLKSELKTLEENVLSKMKSEEWSDGIFKEIGIAHPDNSNHVIKIKVGLENAELVLQE